MMFSLILATYGDASEIPRLLTSLDDQGRVEIELIIVDQNGDDRIADVLARHACAHRVIHLRARPGLSAARNIGLSHASGDILAFPDDDCWYPSQFLESAQRLLRAPDIDAITCRCTDEQGRLAAGGEDRRSGPVTKNNVWRRGVSATMLIKREAVHTIGRFDETLGLGAPTPFQSGEETDFLLRALNAGLRINYTAKLSVYHPRPPSTIDAGALAKAHAYGLGMGRVLRLHRYSLAAVVWHVFMPLLGACHAFFSAKPALARLRTARARARFEGWMHAPRAAQGRAAGSHTDTAAVFDATPCSLVAAIHAGADCRNAEIYPGT